MLKEPFSQWNFKNILINKSVNMENLRTFHILSGKVSTESSVQKAFDQGIFLIKEHLNQGTEENLSKSFLEN